MTDRPSRRPPPAPYRRSELSTPGHDLRMLQKAAGTPTDLVLMDLEDGCAPGQKGPARAVVVEAARTLDWSGKMVAVRTNGTATPYFLDDVLDVVGGAGEFLDVIIAPKVRSAEEVRFIDRLLHQVERRAGLEEGRLGLELMIETPGAVLQAPEIARASPRVRALLFGLYDYAGEIGASVEEETFRDFAYAKQRTVAAARDAGVLVLDGITARYKDLERTEREGRAARRMGFDGKWAVHPSQIEAIHRVFTPTPEELERAARRVAAYREAGRAGRGAIAEGEEMVDEATLRTEIGRVELGRRLGLLPR